MAIESTPDFAIRYGWETGEGGWGGDMNQNLAVLSVAGQLVIESLAFSAPPPTAQTFELYGVNENAGGAWAGRDGQLALLLNDGWLFIEPQYGWRARLRSQENFVWYTGAAWVNEATGKPVEGDQGDTSKLPIGQKINITRPGQPAPGEKWTFLIDEPMVIAAGAAGSLAVCDTAGAESFYFTILRNDNEVGRVSFAAGDYEGTFIVPSSLTLGVGDKLNIVAPGTTISGLSGVSMLIRLLFASAN